MFKQTVGMFVLNNFGLNCIWPWPFFVADPDPAHSEATISKCGEVNVVSLSNFIIIFYFLDITTHSITKGEGLCHILFHSTRYISFVFIQPIPNIPSGFWYTFLSIVIYTHFFFSFFPLMLSFNHLNTLCRECFIYTI